MQEPATASARLRVGEFEVDLRCGEVRRNGDKIKLQQRPFQILSALLERPGDVVTREEIQQKLWPTDTFVDFEHSINTAVNKLREALGDDAENPRFITARLHLGLCYYAAGRREDAMSEWRAVLEMVPENKSAQMYLAMLEPKSGGSGV